MQEDSPMRPCIHLLLLHKLINIIKLTKNLKTKLFGSHQSLQVVVVGIDDASIYLATSRMMPRAVHEEGNVLLATLILRCAQLSERLQSKLLIFLSFHAAHILLQFEQGISHHTSRASILRSLLELPDEWYLAASFRTGSYNEGLHGF